MALCHFGFWTCFCCGPIYGLATAKRPRTLSRHQSGQFFLLCFHRGARLAPDRRTGRPGSCDRQAEEFVAPPHHDGRDVALLALHGCSLGIPAFVAMDETVVPNSQEAL